MSMVSDTQSIFWARHFAQLATTTGGRHRQDSDHSQTPLAVQTYAYVVEACGEIRGKHVLDCGFGTGELARILDLLGGAVDAIDLVHHRIPRLREATPSVYWNNADLANWTLPPAATKYDLIVACEVLQYVDFDRVVANLVDALDNGGRLMIVIPNADCPTVQEVSKRFGNRYEGISGRGVQQRFSRYAGQLRVAMRGIRFRQTESPVPYESSGWRKIELSHPSPLGIGRGRATPPNRLQLVISKIGGAS